MVGSTFRTLASSVPPNPNIIDTTNSKCMQGYKKIAVNTTLISNDVFPSSNTQVCCNSKYNIDL
jgi:hypothetical protein